MQLNPLSVQATSLVRSIDALSTIFWLCFLGFFLSLFFAGLAQLEDNTYTDYLFLGEDQVPKAILPLASLSFAVFAFWLVANRLQMLSYVLGTTNLSFTMVRDIFHLNPPVLHIFDRSNENPWSPISGVSVFVFIWSIFFGNAIALVWAGVVQQSASLSEFDPVLMTIYAIAFVGVIVFGARSITPPLRAILKTLHGIDFRLGWQRHCMAFLLIAITFTVNEFDQFSAMVEQEDNLLGPAYANAIDGETLYLKGIEVSLFGIDAVERDQVCQNQTGADYPCGNNATQALQSLVQKEQVICLPIVSINDRRILGVCELLSGKSTPTSAEEFIDEYRPHNLSRLMVVNGHAIGIGAGADIFDEEQLEAQTLRKGIWQGSFVPPRLWRNSN
ncbi:MAG: thermonuclease family protein [Pseudomonadota bacterium]